MEMLHVIIWIIYPYSVVAIMGMGLVWQYDISQPSVLKTHKFLKSVLTGLLGLSFLSGVGIFIFYRVTDDPTELFQWVISLVQLQPEMDIIQDISILSRAHFFLLITSFLLLSFTRHATFFLRPHIYLRNLIFKRQL